MNDFKLKLVLSILSGIVFSFIFILLAFALPINETSNQQVKVVKPQGRLEEISQAMKER